MSSQGSKSPRTPCKKQLGRPCRNLQECCPHFHDYGDSVPGKRQAVLCDRDGTVRQYIAPGPGEFCPHKPNKLKPSDEDVADPEDHKSYAVWDNLNRRKNKNPDKHSFRS